MRRVEVERFRWGRHGGEVLVRARVVRVEERAGVGRVVVIGETFDRSGPRPCMSGVVAERDVLAAMIEVDGPAPVAHAETYDHRRGQGLKFPTPESAAAHLEGLGWRCTPPAEVEPLEPRYAAAFMVGVPRTVAAKWWVLDRPGITTSIAAGPFATKILADAEAEKLNREESER